MTASHNRPNVNKGRYMERGLPAKLLRLFNGPNGENLEMTRLQLCAHFGCTLPNLCMAISKLRDEGQLQSVSLVRKPKPTGVFAKAAP
jgi:hypothetical protein